MVNEARTVQRYCAGCGKWFSAHLDAKKHWWNKRKINEEKSEGCFLGDVPLSRMRNWCILDSEGGMKYIHPWWKRPFLVMWYRIEDFLDPREMAEYWECNECMNETQSSVTRAKEK